MSRRHARAWWALGLVIGLAASPCARAADLPAPTPPPMVAPVATPDLLSPFYVGAGFGPVHHTGYLPDTSPAGLPPMFNHLFDVQQWVPGGKVFGGYEVYDWLRVEAAFHWLGSATFSTLAISPLTGGIVPNINKETSWALAGSAVFVSPAFPPLWVFPETHAFARLGLAYKDITQQTSVVGTLHEGTVAAVLGAGVEYRFPYRWFARIEYEHVSAALSGPSSDVPALTGIMKVRLGGTTNVVDVMHTPLAVSIGHNF